MKNPKLYTLGLAAATALLFAGCGQNEHAGHDHDHDHAGHDHSAHAAPSEPAGDAPAVQVIEKPTAEQIAAAKPYTAGTCVVSDEALGSMGEPIVVLVGDQQIKLCCNHCLPDVRKDPAGVLAKLAESQKTSDGAQP